MATRARTRSSSARIRRSRSEWPTSSPATLPTPRTPSRTASSRPGARSAASAPASRCGRGSSRSPRTRPATAAAPPAGASSSRSRPRSLSGEAAPSPEDAALDAAQREQLLAALEELPDGRARGARVPLPARALRGGDRRGARRRARHRQVALGARARPAEGGVWISRRELRALPIDWPATPQLRARARATAPAVAARRCDRARGGRRRVRRAAVARRDPPLLPPRRRQDPVRRARCRRAETRPLDAGLGAPVIARGGARRSCRSSCCRRVEPRPPLHHERRGRLARLPLPAAGPCS